MNPVIVVDTNVLIRSIYNEFDFYKTKYGGSMIDDIDKRDPEWAPMRILDLIWLKRVSLVISPALRAELVEVLGRNLKPSEDMRNQFSKLITLVDQSALVQPTAQLEICRDPDDNRILECALTGNAQFIITEDQDLLSISEFNGISILRPYDFTEQLDQMTN